MPSRGTASRISPIPIPQPQGYGGGGGGGFSEPILAAIDYKTGNVAWKHKYPSGGFGNSFPGSLSTAGKLLFTGDPSGNLLAYDPADGKILWHFRTGTMVSNGPSTYMLNGSQYLVVGAGDTLVRLQVSRSTEMMTRRQILGAAGAASAWLAVEPGQAQSPAKRLANLGGAPAGFPIRTRAGRGGSKPFDFVEHCHNLGLGVVETRLASTDPEAIKTLRQKVEGYQMRLVLDVGYPRDEAGVAAFDASVKAAKECGAISLHAAMTGRRYEDMNSLEEFRPELRTLPEIDRAGRAHSAQAPHAAGDREPQGLAFRRTGGVDETRGQRVGGRALRFRQ